MLKLKLSLKTNRPSCGSKTPGSKYRPTSCLESGDRLYRGDKSRSLRSLGLGLSFVKAVTQAHHGKVEASPNPGSGAIFTLYLPLVRTV
jgi:signal transduction histidine kinase